MRFWANKFRLKLIIVNKNYVGSQMTLKDLQNGV